MRYIKEGAVYSNPLSWEDLADMYPGNARTMPMNEVFDFFAEQKDKFFVDDKDGTIHLITQREK